MKAKLSLAERIFRCEGCSLVIDRDVNAAKNLLLELAVSGRGACGAEVRPSRAGHTAVKQEGTPRSRLRGDPKQEPGTAQAGKTGTATGQPVAAGRLANAH